jgi:hypothetical protein
MEIIIDDKTGAEIVYIVNEDGSTTSMLKSTYEAQQAQAEHFTPMIPGDE